MMTKVFAKKLFGVKYEKIMRNLIISAVLFGGLYYSGIHIAVAPFVICLMVTALTVGEMWHALTSDDNAANMKQIFMLPMDSKEFIVSYIACLGGYVFLTRTMPLLAVVFAVSTVSVRMIVMALLCAVSGTLMAAGIMVWKKARMLAFFWLAGMTAAFWYFNQENITGMVSEIIWLVVGMSIILEAILLLKTDIYAFYREETGKKNVIKGRKHHSVWLYFFRYMSSHTNYIVNTLMIWAVAAVLPLFFKMLVEESPSMITFVVPIGLAILSLNTPICIMLSSDRELEQAVRYLPGQKNAFFVPYCMFIFVCNMIADAIYLVSLKLQLGGVTLVIIVIAVMFALISAILSVLLEAYFPLRGWKIENELWNHPRKYLVPGVMVVLAGLVGAILH